MELGSEGRIGIWCSLCRLPLLQSETPTDPTPTVMGTRAHGHTSSPLPGPPAGPLQQITFVSPARPQAHSCVPVAAQSGTLGKGHNILAVGSLLKGLTGTFCPKWSGLRSKPHELHIKRGEAVTGSSSWQSGPQRTKEDSYQQALPPKVTLGSALPLNLGRGS